MSALGELVLELSDWCPLRCRHCSSNSGPDCCNRLRRDAAFRVINEAHELGFGKVSFSGGEPTASADFLGALRAAIEHGMEAEVFTCGVAVRESVLAPFSRVLIDALRDAPGAKLIFSLHGPDARAHDAISQATGSFKCLIASLDSCLGCAIRCELNFVPLRPNVDGFPNIVGLAEERGVERISILRFVPQGRGARARSELELTAEEEGEFLEDVLRLRSHTGVEIRTGSPFNDIVPGNAVPCRAGSAKLVVQADGNVLPCEVFKHHDRRGWSLNVHRSSLREIMHSPQLDALRRTLRATQCLECPVHSALRLGQHRGSAHAKEPQAAVPG